MFGNNFSNSGNQEINVNTRLETWFSETGVLTIGCWNNKLSLKFTPAVGKNEDGITQYSKDKKASTALDMKNCKALLHGLTKVIKPFLEDESVPVGETKLVSVSMGAAQKRNILSIRVEKLERGYSVKLVLNQGIAEGNIANPETTYVYTFSNKECVYNYDDETGNYETEEIVPSEYEVFYDILKYITNMFPLAYHGEKLSQAMGGQGKAASGGFNNSPSYQQPSMNSGSYEAPSQSFNGFDEGLPFN